MAQDERPLNELHPHQKTTDIEKDYDPENDIAESYKHEDGIKDYCDLPPSETRSGLGKFIDKFKDTIEKNEEKDK